MKWRERLTNADIEMSHHARNKGKAKIEIYYYGDRNGTVRKIINVMPCQEEEFYDKGLDDD